MFGTPTIPVTDSPYRRLPLRAVRATCGARDLECWDAIASEGRWRIGNRIGPHGVEQFLGEGFQINSMGVACVGDSVENSDRTADAQHSIADHNPYGRRPSPHDFVDRHIGIDGFRSLHGRVSKERHLSAAPRQELCAGANNRRTSASPSRATNSALAVPKPGT